MSDISTVRTFLESLNIDSGIIDVYIVLVIHGPSSISAVARQSGVQRNKIYRMQDKLLNSKLIIVDVEPAPRLRAVNALILRDLLDDKLRQVTALYGDLLEITKIISSKSI